MQNLWRARPLTLTSLCHSGYKLQGICICSDTFSDDSSLKSFLLHQYQTSALLFCMTFFQRQGFYYLNLTQLTRFILVCCTSADIFRYTSLSSPCTGSLGKQQVNEFRKTPSWQVTSYSRKTFITIISIIKYYTANAVQNGLLVGCLVWSSCPWRHVSKKLPRSVVWPQPHLPSREETNTLHRQLAT